MLRLHFPRRIASLPIVMLIAGCAVGGETLANSATLSITKPAPPAAFNSTESYQMYNVMLAEMLVRNGLFAEAAKHYASAAKDSKNTALIKRATEVALQAKETALAQELLSHWLELDPDSLEARQYRVLLRARLKEYDQALDDMVWVRDHIEESRGHGFEYVVSLLALESGAADTYEIFKRYADRFEGEPKARLIEATMALHSEQYEKVLPPTQSVMDTGDTGQKEQAALLNAQALIALKRNDDAISALEPLVSETENTELKLKFAHLLVTQDRRAEARPLFKELYASQPDNPEVLYALGLLYLEQEEYAFAEALMKKLMDVPARKNEASYFLGRIYEGQKRVDDALEAYEQALNGQLMNDAINYKTALLQREKGIDEALVWLREKRDESVSDKRKALFLIFEGQFLHEHERYAEAVQAFDQAAERDVALQRDVLYSRSLSYESMGQFDQAEKDLRFLLKENAEDANALNALGYMLTIRTERYEEARELISKALELEPESGAILDSMGWVLFKLNDLNGAEKYLRKAFEKMRDPEVASHLVEVLYKQGERVEAERILSEMLKEHPDDKLLVDVNERLAILNEKP